MTLLSRLRILPLLVLVSLFSFTVRFADVVTEFKTLDQVMTVSTMAEEKPAQKQSAATTVPEGLPATAAVPLPADNWADPTTAGLAFTDTQTSILKELTARREELDQRENRLNQREALLKVTEKQIEEKTQELQAIRLNIEQLLDKQSDEEEARLQSLVKIYSGMKPKEAAEIFNELDMDILIQVVGRMSERKSAPILAGMDTKRAQNLTILLAEQKKLPELPAK